MKINRTILLLILIFSIGNCFADNSKTSDYQNSLLSTDQFQNLAKDQQNKIAKAWGLTPEEYAKYLYYIHYTPDATTYDAKTTNPLWILAAHTKDQQLYEEYLRKSVVIEHYEVGRMLKVGQDFSKMAKKMYPNEYPVMPPWLITNKLQSGDVVQLFCNVKNQTCNNLLGKILPQIRNTTGTQLDVFAVGKANAKDIIQFGKTNKINQTEVANKKITLNFGSKAFALLQNAAHKKLPLPFVVVRRAGQEIPINLTGGSK